MSSRTSPQYGVVLGRLQPLHVGHVEYLEAARQRCDRLVIGVTSPFIDDLVDDDADPRRSLVASNPFSYFDRLEMIGNSLIELGWSHEEFVIVPADINRPSSLHQVLPPPKSTTVFLTVYDAWGDRKVDFMTELGYEVEVLWRRTMGDRVTSGSFIREAIRSGTDWRDVVPGAVARYLDQLNTKVRT